MVCAESDASNGPAITGIRVADSRMEPALTICRKPRRSMFAPQPQLSAHEGELVGISFIKNISDRLIVPVLPGVFNTRPVRQNAISTMRRVDTACLPWSGR